MYCEEMKLMLSEKGLGKRLWLLWTHCSSENVIENELKCAVCRFLRVAEGKKLLMSPGVLLE